MFNSEFCLDCNDTLTLCRRYGAHCQGLGASQAACGGGRPPDLQYPVSQVDNQVKGCNLESDSGHAGSPPPVQPSLPHFGQHT